MFDEEAQSVDARQEEEITLVHPCELDSCSCNRAALPLIRVPGEENPRCFECAKPVQEEVVAPVGSEPRARVPPLVLPKEGAPVAQGALAQERVVHPQ